MSISQPQPDSNNAAMIAVGPAIGVNIDACIAKPFAVKKGDVCEQSPSKVTITKIGAPPYNGCPEAVDGVAAVPMPPTLTGWTIDNFGDARMVVDVYTYDGARFKSFEMFQPKQTGPNEFSCQTGCWHYADRNYTQTMFTPGGGSGGGLSLAQCLLRAADLNGAIQHPMLCTLPPRFFGLTADGDNESYCANFATLPLGATQAEGGVKGAAAWGPGATVYLKSTWKASHILSADAQKFVTAAMTQGFILCDRDSATRKPEVLAIVGEADPRIVALSKELATAFKLSDFYVGKISARYNYHTKQYPVL